MNGTENTSDKKQTRREICSIAFHFALLMIGCVMYIYGLVTVPDHVLFALVGGGIMAYVLVKAADAIVDWS